MAKREKKKDPRSGKKKPDKPAIHPKKDDTSYNQDQNDSGGMDFSNFRKNLGCG